MHWLLEYYLYGVLVCIVLGITFRQPLSTISKEWKKAMSSDLAMAIICVLWPILALCILADLVIMSVSRK